MNGLHVNFEDKVNRLEDRIATLEREHQRLRLGDRDLLLPPRHLRQQGEKNGRSVPWLARTPRTGPGFPQWALREERDASRMKWLAKGFM